MKKYYALSQMAERNVLTHLRGVNALLVNNLEDVKKENCNIQSLDDVDESNDLVYFVTTYFNKFNFSIRGTVDEMYIISNDFLDLLKIFNIRLKKIFNLNIVNINNYSEIIKNKYYLVAFYQVSFENILDLDKSSIYQEFPITIDGIEKIVIEPDAENDFFIIKELNASLKTPMCSNIFRIKYEEMKLKGVKFLSLEEDIKWVNDSLDGDHIEPV